MGADTIILGAGVTGLAAALSSGLRVFEAQPVPGGICSSYYVRPGEGDRLYRVPDDGEAYRFEIGGGHWIFGGDPAVLEFIRRTTTVKTYRRRSAVYFSRDDLYVPYPIQNHLSYLGRDTAAKVIDEIINAPRLVPETMAEWLEVSFGKTLTELFFAPFHELYTAGLWTRIAPQDAYKSPVDLSCAVRGALGESEPVGYNVTFIYPEEGLNELAGRMGDRAEIHYSSRVAAIDPRRREVQFEDGSGVGYERLISTLPLNKMVDYARCDPGEEPDCYTSVLVLNIGAERGERCPDHHWLYIPDSRSRFHRVGFYSNVDPSFLPASSRKENSKVSIYVEKAYVGGQRPADEEVRRYAADTVAELKEWGFVGDVEVVDPTWIEVAYTWSWPGSRWRQNAMEALRKQGIFQVGRYARWVFQGIADSLRDGFFAGAALGR